MEILSKSKKNHSAAVASNGGKLIQGGGKAPPVIDSLSLEESTMINWLWEKGQKWSRLRRTQMIKKTKDQ